MSVARITVPVFLGYDAFMYREDWYLEVEANATLDLDDLEFLEGDYGTCRLYTDHGNEPVGTRDTSELLAFVALLNALGYLPSRCSARALANNIRVACEGNEGYWAAFAAIQSRVSKARLTRNHGAHKP